MYCQTSSTVGTWGLVPLIIPEFLPERWENLCQSLFDGCCEDGVNSLAHLAFHRAKWAILLG